MKCPNCGSDQISVKRSYPPDDDRVKKRRYECKECQTRFNTYEVVENVLREMKDVPFHISAAKGKKGESGSTKKSTTSKKSAIKAKEEQSEPEAATKPKRSRSEIDADFEKLHRKDIKGWATLLAEMGEQPQICKIVTVSGRRQSYDH